MLAGDDPFWAYLDTNYGARELPTALRRLISGPLAILDVPDAAHTLNDRDHWPVGCPRCQALVDAMPFQENAFSYRSPSSEFVARFPTNRNDSEGVRRHAGAQSLPGEILASISSRPLRAPAPIPPGFVTGSSACPNCDQQTAADRGP